MSIRFSKAFFAQLLSLLLVTPSQLWGWGNTGHEAVAYVAWQQMTPATRARVMDLLKRVPTLKSPRNISVPGYADWVTSLPPGLSQDDQNLYLFMRAATWPDTIKHVGFKDSDTPPTGITNDVNIGYRDKTSHGYWHFVDAGFASDGSRVPATPIPNAETQIVALRQAIGSNENDDLKSYDLVWLEHLVGDIHQPLHGTVRYFAGKGDVGGNLVQIKLPLSMEKEFEGKLSKDAPRELHAFWDDLPGEGQPAPALPEAKSFAQPLPVAPADKVADVDPSDWAMESLTMAKMDAYASPIGNGPQPAVSNSLKSKSGRASTNNAYLITDAYYEKAMQDAKDRIALAGARLAKLLNENLK
jgi:hypothetical protein